MASVDMCEHDWPGSGCKKCKMEGLEASLAAERRRATDAEYMLLAIIPMLGPKGRQVVKMWKDKGIERVHFDWAPGFLAKTSGEDVAQVHLDLDAASTRELTREEMEAF